MPKEKTICEVEFEKWWGDTEHKIFYIHRKRGVIYKEEAEYVWNQSWKTCGDKIMGSIKK